MLSYTSNNISIFNKKKYFYIKNKTQSKIILLQIEDLINNDNGYKLLLDELIKNELEVNFNYNFKLTKKIRKIILNQNEKIKLFNTNTYYFYNNRLFKFNLSSLINKKIKFINNKYTEKLNLFENNNNKLDKIFIEEKIINNKKSSDIIYNAEELPDIIYNAEEF